MSDQSPESLQPITPENATRNFLGTIGKQLGDHIGAIGLSELAFQVMFGVVEHITQSPIDPITKYYLRGTALGVGIAAKAGGLKPVSFVDALIKDAKRPK
jgi:hypothetical protein